MDLARVSDALAFIRAAAYDAAHLERPGRRDGPGGLAPHDRKVPSMKQKTRYRRRKKADGLVDEWPASAPSREELAARVTYVGSAEHKGRPVHASFDFAPALRTDASRCDPSIDREAAQTALREAVRRGCVSQQFENGFPRYVWGWIDGRPHMARLDNRDQGAYKGWPIEREELPMDRQGRLAPPENGDA